MNTATRGVREGPPDFVATVPESMPTVVVVYDPEQKHVRIMRRNVARAGAVPLLRNAANILEEQDGNTDG